MPRFGRPQQRAGPRHVHVDGDNRAPIITGDHNTVVYRGGVAVFSLQPLVEPPPMPGTAGPAAVLAARHEVVPYTGRADEQTDALAWLATPPRRSVCLMTGQGGQGKSRFALRVARLAAADGWRVLVAHRDSDGDLITPDQAARQVPAPGAPVGTLVLVDYADRWQQRDLFDLLTRPDTAVGRLRLLLLGRAADFWEQLRDVVESVGVETCQVPLRDLPDDVTARRALFDAAVHAFAEHTSDRPHPVALQRLVAGLAVPDLAGPGFELTLAVQMAALLAVLERRDQVTDGRPGSAREPSGAAALSRKLLLREQRHWQRMTQRHPDPVRASTAVMARAVFVATLARGLPRQDARDLLDQLPTGHSSTADLLADHAKCYPPGDPWTALHPLYPDRLGEDLVAAMLTSTTPDTTTTPAFRSDQALPAFADPTADAILATLLSTPPEAENAPVSPTSRVRESALTVLAETAQRWHHVARDHLIPALKRHPALLTTSVSPAALPALGNVIDDFLGAGTHITLAAGAAAVQQRLTNHLRELGNPATLANALNTLAVRQSAAGHRPEALTAAEEATTLRRELANHNRDAYLPNLADSLNNLAVDLAEAGRRTEALTAAEEATTLYRELASHNRDAYLPNLATSLNNLANHLAEAGRRTEALTTAEEATTLRRELASHNRDAYLPNLADSLNNLANRLAEAGRHTEALTTAEEATGYWRELAERWPDWFAQDLAKSEQLEAWIRAAT